MAVKRSIFSSIKRFIATSLCQWPRPSWPRELEGCSLNDLAGQRLIHLHVRSQNWTTWPDWFSGLGYTGAINEGTTVTNYSLALQFAQKGPEWCWGGRR